MSIRAIAHRIRWNRLVETQSGDGFKLNNNHLSFYARKAERENPDLRGFFTERKSGSDQGEIFG